MGHWPELVTFTRDLSRIWPVSLEVHQLCVSSPEETKLKTCCCLWIGSMKPEGGWTPPRGSCLCGESAKGSREQAGVLHRVHSQASWPSCLPESLKPILLVPSFSTWPGECSVMMTPYIVLTTPGTDPWARVMEPSNSFLQAAVIYSGRAHSSERANSTFLETVRLRLGERILSS